MKLSKRSEYGLLAMIELGKHYTKGNLSTALISRRQQIPRKFLEQILLQLKTAGYVVTKRGPSGGTSLAKPPKEISLAEIVRVLDGALAPVESVSEYFYSSTPIEQNDELIAVFKEVRNLVADKMERTSLSDVLPLGT